MNKEYATTVNGKEVRILTPNALHVLKAVTKAQLSNNEETYLEGIMYQTIVIDSEPLTKDMLQEMDAKDGIAIMEAFALAYSDVQDVLKILSK